MKTPGLSLFAKGIKSDAGDVVEAVAFKHLNASMVPDRPRRHVQFSNQNLRIVSGER